MAWYRCGGTPSSVLSLPTPSEASGSIARFNTDLTENLLSAVAEFSATQASGIPTPSTPIPIVGVDKVNVTLCGINLWDEVLESGTISSADGSNAPYSAGLRTKNYIPIKPSTIYFCYCGTFTTTTTMQVRFYDRNKNYIGYVNEMGNAVGWNTSSGNSICKSPSNACYMRFALQNTYGTTYNNDISINYPATDTEYHAYNGTTALINLGGTYYGGSVDAVTGKITLTHKIGQITEADDKYGTWDTEQVMGAFWHASIAQCPWLNDWDNSVRNNGIKVDKYTLQSNVSTNTSTYSMAVYTTKLIRWVDVDRMTMTKEDYNTYLASNPITILYPLATPIVVYASNTAEIPTLNGDNQVFADSGNIAVKFLETVGHKI